MPPPPPTFVVPAPVTRKRPRDAGTEDTASQPIKTASMGTVFLDLLRLGEHFLVRCMKWIPPVEEWGRSGDLYDSLIGRTNWPAVLVYVLCLSLCFLSQHASPDLPVMDVWSAAISFDIFPPLAVDHWNPKLLLTWGSTMGSLFVCSLPLSLPSPPSPLHFYWDLSGVQEELCEKKSKVEEDASGLVPYEGDSSDEEEERTLSSKTDQSWLPPVLSQPPRIPTGTKSASSWSMQFSNPKRKRKIHSVLSHSFWKLPADSFPDFLALC